MQVIEYTELAQMLEKAAAEIERLEAENARLEQEIEKLAKDEWVPHKEEDPKGESDEDWADILKQANENSDVKLGAPSQFTMPKDNAREKLEGWLASLA